MAMKNAASKRILSVLSSPSRAAAGGAVGRHTQSARRAFSSSKKEGKFVDPQVEAQGRIDENVGKLSGIEAVEALPSGIRRNNQLMAAGLAAFVGYVFYYSMASVGKTAGTNADDPIAKLEQEAQQARTKKEQNH